MSKTRYAGDKFPCLEKPILTKEDVSLLTDYCAIMGYILDITDVNCFIKTTDNKKVFIQKDYWNNIMVVKNRFTPKEEWENITENIRILAGTRHIVKKPFFRKYMRSIFGILSFNSNFEILPL